DRDCTPFVSWRLRWQPLSGCDPSILAMAYSSDGRRLAAFPIERCFALVWDAGRGEALPSVSLPGPVPDEGNMGHPALPLRLAFSAAREAIIFVGVRRVERVDIRSGAVRQEIWYTGRGEAVCAMSPDSHRTISMHGCGVGLLYLVRGRKVTLAGDE